MIGHFISANHSDQNKSNVNLHTFFIGLISLFSTLYWEATVLNELVIAYEQSEEVERLEIANVTTLIKKDLLLISGSIVGLLILGVIISLLTGLLSLFSILILVAIGYESYFETILILVFCTISFYILICMSSFFMLLLKDEYDILLVEDEISRIRPFSIGDVDTKQYISSILSQPEIPDTRDGYFTTWLNLSYKLKNKSIKKSQYIGYIERRIDRNIPSYLTKKEVMKIAMYVGYSYEIDSIENPDENRKVSGGKMKKKKRIVGKGISQHPKKIVVNKFSVNMEKLKNNILNVQYTSCRGSVPSMKIERISDDVKSVLMDILENQYNSKLFDKLLSDDQRIISNFVRTLKIPNINMDNFDKKYQHEYEVLLGEVRSGNDNEQIKKKLKQYILRGISENLIPRAQGLNQILNL